MPAIHPFSDGNGRTCRLLMNLMLLRGGYPPVAVGMPERKRYQDALEGGSVHGDIKPFQLFLQERLKATLDEYLRVLEEE